MPPSTPSEPPISLILLKSPSPTQSTDPYTTHFPPPRYNPTFLPPLHTVQLPTPPSLIDTLTTAPPLTSSYAALIFTSQRAVSAFAAALAAACPLSEQVKASESAGILRAESLAELQLPLYAVGPATARALRTEVQTGWLRSCWVVGEEAGRGEDLAKLIIKDLAFKQEPNEVSSKATLDDPEAEPQSNKKPVLFLTGETRREVLPHMLREADIPVDEAVVYATKVDPQFEDTVRKALTAQNIHEIRWIVLFSPQGSHELLRALNWLGDERSEVEPKGTKPEGAKPDGKDADRDGGRSRGKSKPNPDFPSSPTPNPNPNPSASRTRQTFIASIGPTTSEYLAREFGFRVDVQAERPSPGGLREGIEGFMRKGRIRDGMG